MQAMKDFVSWFVSQLPLFLMSEPISALTALFILGFVADLVFRMMGLRRFR